MTRKIPLCPVRIRTVPPHFSWVDHRLVRDHYLEELSHEACALYLFLVTVADSLGLSYYSDEAISRRLAMVHATLVVARTHLRTAGLIAYKKPLYQVLSLDAALPAKSDLAAILMDGSPDGLQEAPHDRL